MKLYNPFTAEDDNIKFCATTSLCLLAGFILAFSILKVGLIATGAIILALTVLGLILTAFSVTIKYVFTGK